MSLLGSVITSLCVTVDAVKAPRLLSRCTAAGRRRCRGVEGVQRGGDDHQWRCGDPAEGATQWWGTSRRSQYFFRIRLGFLCRWVWRLRSTSLGES